MNNQQHLSVLPACSHVFFVVQHFACCEQCKGGSRLYCGDAGRDRFDHAAAAAAAFKIDVAVTICGGSSQD